MTPFAAIHEAALMRHGHAALEARLPTPRSAAELEAMPEDRYLAQMSLRIFRAGLKHELVDRKWPAFEEAFRKFDPDFSARLPDEAIEALLEDRRLIRNLPKLRAVRANAGAILELRQEGAIGAWIARWPGRDIVTLWDEIARRFQQMGGRSAPMFLRMIGKDSFVLSDAVVRGLIHWGAIAGEPRSKADRAAVQEVFNAWAEETGLPLCRLSMILAMSLDT
jgi:3-methyladenine DNA glycosylase Tag